MATSVDLTTYPSARNDASEDKWSNAASALIRDGVLWTIGNALQPFADSTGMQIKVKSGRMVIQGFFGDLASQQTLTVASAHATLNRIDAIVGRLVRTSPATVKVAVVTGAASASPVLPTLTNDATTTEILLGRIFVNAAVTTITAGDVGDDRPEADKPIPVRLIGLCNGSGDATITHNLPSDLPARISSLTAVYKGNSGEAKPLGINYIDGSVISLSGGGGAASKACYVALTYTQKGIGW